MDLETGVIYLGNRYCDPFTGPEKIRRLGILPLAGLGQKKRCLIA